MAFILKSNIILQIASISMTTRIVLIKKTMLRLKSMSTFLENAWTAHLMNTRSSKSLPTLPNIMNVTKAPTITIPEVAQIHPAFSLMTPLVAHWKISPKTISSMFQRTWGNLIQNCTSLMMFCKNREVWRIWELSNGSFCWAFCLLGFWYFCAWSEASRVLERWSILQQHSHLPSSLFYSSGLSLCQVSW